MPCRQYRVAGMIAVILLLGVLLPVLWSVAAQARPIDARQALMRPRIRKGCHASASMAARFAKPQKLGRHCYRSGWFEETGILYTAKGGFIDLAHLRKGADWTAYLAYIAAGHLGNGDTEYSFTVRERSTYVVKLTYPQDWDSLPSDRKTGAIQNVAAALGQHFAFTATSWHEILTWFGYKGSGILPESESAFSWEDTYSDLLGSHIGRLAVEDPQHDYDQAVTTALGRELKRLGIQPKKTAMRIASALRGQWYETALLLIDTKRRRNFDIGADDGYVTPWIVPADTQCDPIETQAYPIPDLSVLEEHGFSMKLEIEPREWERKKIFKVIYPADHKQAKRLEPAIHFAPIMAHIREQARAKHGPDIDSPATTVRLTTCPERSESTD